MIANKARVSKIGTLSGLLLFPLKERQWPNLKTPQHYVCTRPFFNHKAQAVVAVAVAMIFDENEQEWADRVGNAAATIAAALMIGIFCYVILIPLIFGHHADFHAAAHY